MNKGILVGIIALIAIVAAGYWLMQFASTVPGSIAPGTMLPDTTSSINADLNQINVEGSDADFMDIEKDLQSL